MSERLQKKVIVYSGEENTNGWPSYNAVEFMEWMREKISQIPAEYMDYASVELGSSIYYDSSNAEIDIYYFRPETDEEAAAREYDDQRRSERNRRHELEMLAALKAKYEQ